MHALQSGNSTKDISITDVCVCVCEREREVTNHNLCEAPHWIQIRKNVSMILAAPNRHLHQIEEPFQSQQLLQFPLGLGH